MAKIDGRTLRATRLGAGSPPKHLLAVILINHWQRSAAHLPTSIDVPPHELDAFVGSVMVSDPLSAETPFQQPSDWLPTMLAERGGQFETILGAQPNRVRAVVRLLADGSVRWSLCGHHAWVGRLLRGLRWTDGFAASFSPRSVRFRWALREYLRARLVRGGEPGAEGEGLVLMVPSTVIRRGSSAETALRTSVWFNNAMQSGCEAIEVRFPQGQVVLIRDCADYSSMDLPFYEVADCVRDIIAASRLNTLLQGALAIPSAIGKAKLWVELIQQGEMPVSLRVSGFPRQAEAGGNQHDVG